MERQQAALRRIAMLDDATGRTVTNDGQTLPAKPGERYSFERLADALTRATAVPAAVSGTLPQALEARTVCVVPAYQLERWRTEFAARNVRPYMVVVDAARESIEQLLKAGVAAVIEHHQYWAWKTNEKADASIYGDLSIVPYLQCYVTVTPIVTSHFGRLRIEGEDLPGLLGDYLLAMDARSEMSGGNQAAASLR